MAQSETRSKLTAEQGEAYYQSVLKAELEVPENIGKFLVLDVETGNYEMDKNSTAAIMRAMNRWPNTVFYIHRIGFDAAYELGGWSVETAA